MRLTIALFYAFPFLLTPAVAQENFKEGLYVTNAGDTVRGFIDQKEWSRNPTSFSFKRNISDSERHDFDLSTVRYFSVAGDIYVRYQGNVSMDQNTLKASDAFSPHFSTNPVFLKVLVRGKIATLFRYRDDLKSRYFLWTKLTGTEELIYRIYPDETQANQVVVDDRFKQQLIQAGTTAGAMTDKLRWKIKKSTYGGSLASIVSEMNGEKKAPGSRQPIHLFASAGLNYTSMHMTPADEAAPKSTPSAGFYASGGLTFIPNPRVGRFVIRTELSFGTATLHIKSDEDFRSTQNTISLSPQVNYNFYNTKALKVYIGAGLRINRSFYGNGTYYTYVNPGVVATTTSVFNFVPIWLNLVAQAGVRIGEKFEINASYNRQMGIFVNDFTFWDQSETFLRVGALYTFDLRRGGK
jgi:hypothetical protein